ncbi:maleylpyruvate isomerase N-terminal domain-containing protein [Mucilaginibacter lutimaris]|uniref:Maleylpyruvate isomerase N-terminal domain-containing protein n=1 Tax=Mucilaginibacter lutimaris TaxID=931629 RepID=A0ABW2ZFE0_9SPHI
MEQVIPIPTLHLFARLDRLLIDLLVSLSPQDWSKLTVARLWTVKDIAAHLLDGNVRCIALLNGHEGPPPTDPINNYQDLVGYLNQLNATWVNAMKRMSPQLLIQQLASTGAQSITYLESLKPFENAKHAVAWAGEETSLNWFHITREYTERWHHQQQIRDAVGKPGILTKELFYPCLDTFMYALPHTYRNVEADRGTIIKITISGDAGGDWYLHKTIDKWIISKSLLHPGNADAEVIIDEDTSWRLFTKAITPYAAMQKSIVTGDVNLSEDVFNTTAVMA